jgi:hypothetical protein
MSYGVLTRKMIDISDTHLVVGGHKVVGSGRMARTELSNLGDFWSSCDLIIVTDRTNKKRGGNRYTADAESLNVMFDIL